MELNKNKIIFFAVGVVLIVMLIILFITLGSRPSTDDTSSVPNDIKIWMVGENINAYDFINSFKELYPAYKNKNVVVEVFPDWQDYTYTLSSAFNTGVGPDIFMLNNNEKNSIFANQVVGISPSKVNPNDFRKIYKQFFSEDLIETFETENGVVESLAGIPIGYELLGVYYNRRYIKNADLANMQSMNNIIANLKNTHRDVIPLGIGNGTATYNAHDIITQFFMLSGINSISNLSGNALREGLASYLAYGDPSGINGYNSRLQKLLSSEKTSLDLFVTGEVFMLVGYPSMINRITEAGGFSKSFLEVAAFPHYVGGGGMTLANYNYFVINKDSQNIAFAEDLLTYISTDTGANSLLNAMPFYLPALLSLEEQMLYNKIDENYNITLGDFYNDAYDISSFNKGVKEVYDTDITLLLDNPNYREDRYDSLREKILCMMNKITNFVNLTNKCG